MEDSGKEMKTEALKPELIFNIAKSVTKLRDRGVTDSQFQLLVGFSFTI